MYKYKYIVDILSSLASFVAIVVVLISWYKSSTKPLKIEKVVVHKKEKESTYILIVKNTKDFPVEIKSTTCFTKRIFKVKQKKDQKPEYLNELNYTYSPFRNQDKFDISANGHTDIKISGTNIDSNLSKLLFTFHTSHGYHELWCKNISTSEIGKVETYSLEEYEFDSTLRAKIKYYFLCLKYFLKS